MKPSIMQHHLKNFQEIFQMKSIDVNSHIDQESTPLMGAIKSDDEELVKMIMGHPTFDPIKSKILSCLFQAVSCKNLNLFKFFLKMNGDDINIKNESNISLLCHAASVKYNIVILNEILNYVKFDPIKSDIEAAFINSKDSKKMEVLVSYDEKHDNLLTLEKIDLKMQLNPIKEDTYENENKSINKAHQYLLRKKGIVPVIHPFCTSVVSKNLYQKLYICDTCQMERICEICAKICHKGHKIKETKYSKEQAFYTGNRSSSAYKNECCCPFPLHLNNPNHKCKCKSKHISEDDENIYEDLFADKENERDYFNPNEDEEEEVVNKKNEVDDNHDFDDLRCTLDLSGLNPTLQPLYHCRKCQVDICQNCAIRCHQGHPLNYKGMSPNSICYCIYVTDCKCTERKETVCAYLFYGKEQINLPFFRCRTCGLSRNRCCCVSCTKHCHYDHDLFSCDYSRSFCDCGYNDMVIACKAMNYPPFNYLTCCTNRDQKYDIKNQRLYHCFTCGITSKDQGICESCAIHCHIGHNVVFVGIKSFACECATMNLYKRKLNCVAYFCPEMRNTGRCSRLNSDNKNAIFGEYVCYTCDKEAKKKFCESFAVKCHKNHDIHFLKYSNFKCDCESCQCMKSDE